MKNHLFTRQNKKNIFFKIPSPFSKKDGFLVFWFCLVKDGFGAKNQLLPRKKMVFQKQTRPKPSCYEGKVGFPVKNHLFTRQNQKKHLFQHPLPILLKSCFFLVFWSRLSRRPVLWSVWGLFCREKATESSKKRHRARAGFKRYLRGKQNWVGHGGGGGGCVHIYMYIYIYIYIYIDNMGFRRARNPKYL